MAVRVDRFIHQTQSEVKVKSLSCVQLFATPWTTAHQASLSITNSQSLLKLMSIESVMPSNHLIICHPLHLSLSIFPSNRVFSNESVRHIRWPKYWSFSLDGSLPCSSIHGILQARMLEWVAIPFSQGSSSPRDRTHVSYISCIGRRVLYTSSLHTDMK